IRHEEDVVGLEIAMNNPALMRLRERATHLLNDRVYLGRGKLPTRPHERLAEVFTIEQLHRDVGTSLPNTVIDDLHDMWTAQLRGSLRFPFEACMGVR